jgi:hypothetical protein
MPVSHDPRSTAAIKWRLLMLDVEAKGWDHAALVLDKYVRSMAAILDFHLRTSRWPDHVADVLAQKGERPLRVSPYERSF